MHTETNAGLTSEEARARLARDGYNELAEAKRKSKIAVFFAQVNEPMIYILFAAAIISAWHREVADTVIILAVVLLNAVIGMAQESRAEAALAALKKISAPFAPVRRDGRVTEIPARELVKGDIVLLEAGRVVPADLRLTRAVNLKIEESALTGESVPVDKDASATPAADAPIGDRLNMAHASTAVAYGRGEGVVTATGMATEVGKIAGILNAVKPEATPLQKRLADLGKLLGAAAVVICVAMFAVAVLQGRDVTEMMLTAISLAVAAVPEGLPAVVTIVLALGVQRLVKVNTIVRRLPSVETLGAVSVVCSDKTGTLTQNRMTVTRVYRDGKLEDVAALDATADALFLAGFTLCNDASALGGSRTGDPTELALIDMGAAHGLVREEMEEDAPRINEKAFDSDRKLMTTVHRGANGVTAYTKGAMDNLLARSVFIYENGVTRAITRADKDAIADAARQMAQSALRVLGLAFKAGDEAAAEEGLAFVGLVGMIDPPRPEAAASVAALKSAGIRTVMITGDHRDTALAIAKELGIAADESQCATGAELDGMTQEELNAAVEGYRVFARVSPSHKVMLVRALKANGHIVSMTGDGVNDAPSLKEADIGVAMGITGTDVAKGAADMVLTDDNFATIEKAVAEGRNIYRNIKKSVLFLLSSNFGEIIAMFGAIVVGLASPLKAIHILWVNLITDALPALALGVDESGKGVMREKPRRPNESLFAHGGLALTIFYGFLVGGMTLAAFLITPIQHVGWHFGAIADYLSIHENLRVAQTFALVTLGTSQLFHAIGMRDVNTSVFRMNHTRNKMMILAFFFGLLLQVAVTEVPFLAAAFDTEQLSLKQWGVLLLVSAIPLAAHEVIVLAKFLRGKR